MAEGGKTDVETQKTEMEALLKTPLRKAETWYLVDSSWFKKWKKYVGFDSWDMNVKGSQIVFPGPVDNSGLFRDWHMLDIKEHLIDELDYYLVPKEGWKKLVSWYGLKDGQEPIARKVVEVGMFVKHYKVEVYLTKLMLCEDNNMDNIVPRRFSKADTIGLIEREMRKLFSVPDEKETRLWGKYMNNTWEPLKNLNSTIQDAGLYQGQVLAIEPKNEDNMWPRDSSKANKKAESRISVDRNEFVCAVCLDLLKDPVTIQCGHSYCKSCITGHWDHEDQKRVYSCPQCRQTFSPRPALARNTMLAEVVEKLKKTELPADCYAGAGDVQCDVCTGRKYKAVKSCLLCLNSYCQNHLEQHEGFFKGKKHNLTEATGRLQEMICSEHEKQLEMCCITDQQCICVLCMKYEHKTHNTVSAAAQRTEIQKQLKETQQMFQQKIQQREKDLQQLRECVESHKRSAQTAVKDSETIFSELIRSIERSHSELIRLIRDQEKTAVSRAEGRLERLEQEINDLRRRDAELEQLSHTQDHIQFLQSFRSLSSPPESTEVNDKPSSPLFSYDGLRESVHQLRDKLEDFCTEEIKKISDRVKLTNIAPKTRNDFLQYSHQLTLDLNTINKHLCLSERNRVIANTDKAQLYPDHPDRFDQWFQVLCRERVCGRCYWEIEWSGDVFISVSYKSISRKGLGKECVFGRNAKSWSLICTPSRYSFIHNNIETELPKVSSHRTGVYVDPSAGTLSFYSVSATMSLIHTVQTTFTQPLYPGFRVGSGSSVKMC
ncbi:tripartite motif-containing protein 16-like isoform X1 [Carassius auratus]|uniref:ubiquitinyl hydrolase 1 n=1 Tax=Carassius auratus TaxID=7957 RepID=A0A6P6JXM0_CARAU|nr:tripartite motif-containing protein 16-like isoform X1 [Carassius auratus]